MKNEIIILIILCGITVSIISIPFIQDYFQNQFLTRNDAIDIMKSKYPNANIDPVFNNNCDGLGNPCWEDEFVDDTGSLVSIDIDVSTGTINEEINECTEWWCDAIHCDYVVKDIQTNYTTTYYNTGCTGPEQSCNITHSVCGICQTKEGCIRKTITDYASESTYRFDVIDTNAYGTINTTAFDCRLYDKNLDMIFRNTTTVAECEMILTYYTKCAYDVCDFVPSYTLIPL